MQVALLFRVSAIVRIGAWFLVIGRCFDTVLGGLAGTTLKAVPTAFSNSVPAGKCTATIQLQLPSIIGSCVHELC